MSTMETSRRTGTVPFVDLVAQQEEILDEVMPELREVLATAGFVGGPHVSAFEEEYAAYVGVRSCVGLGNGTDAVELALRAIGVGAGDEVVIPANTFVATAEAVCRTGATPVLVDVEEGTLLMDPGALADAVGPRTRAVVPVHLYGQMVDVDAVRAVVAGRDVAVVEDAAQSQGARRGGVSSGAAGDVAATSFYPGKNLGAAGDAGAVTTDDLDLADRVRLLGNHGSRQKYVHESLGFNSRLDAAQAVVLRHKLRRLDGWNGRRRAAAARYDELLAGIDGVVPPTVAVDSQPVWHLYVIRVADRDAVLERLLARGIGAALHYPTPVHLTPAFGFLGHGVGAFPVAEAAASRILSLPMFPHLRPDQQERVAHALSESVVLR